MSVVYIAGHSGFIGSAVKERLDCSGLIVRGVSRKNGFDLLNLGDLENEITSPSFIINAAGLTGVAESWKDPKEFVRTNCGITLNIMEVARRTGAHVIHLSSYMYGHVRRGPINEDYPTLAPNPYAISKYKSELICRKYSELYDIPVKVLRIFNLYGPRQPDDYFIPTIIEAALHGGEVSIGPLGLARDYLWVDDLADAIAVLLDLARRDFDVFNIGSGVLYSAGELIELVEQSITGAKIKYRIVGEGYDTGDSRCDYTKFSFTTGWLPRTSIEAGINRLIALSSVE